MKHTLVHHHLARLAIGAMLSLAAATAQAQFTANYQTNIVDGTDLVQPSYFFVGNGFHHNTLYIINGGSVSNMTNYASMGGLSIAGSNALAVVSGANSLWTGSGTFYMGHNGAKARLEVRNGGTVRFLSGGDPTLIVGLIATSTNNEIIVDAGTLIASSPLMGKLGGDNRLTVTNGGQVLLGNSAYGFRVGYGGEAGKGSDNNVISISGEGSLLSTGYLYLYNAGNTVSVRDGGTLELTKKVERSDGNGTISNIGGIYQFTMLVPLIFVGHANYMSISNGTIAYRAVTEADIFEAHIANLPFAGQNSFKLNTATNSSTVSQTYTFDPTSNPKHYVRLVLANGSTYRNGNVTIGNGGELRVEGAASTLSNNLTFVSGATFTSRINSPSNYGSLVAHGAVTLGGAKLALEFTSAPPMNVPYTLIDKVSGTVDGTFASGVVATLNGAPFEGSFQVSTTGGSGNDVVVTRVPSSTLITIR